MQFLSVLDKVYVFIQPCLCKAFLYVRLKGQSQGSVCNYAGEAAIYKHIKCLCFYTKVSLLSACTVYLFSVLLQRNTTTQI